MQIPKGERLWAQYFNREHELIFIMTSKALRDFYFLYEVEGDRLKKLGKAKTPTELEEKFHVARRMEGAGAD